MDSFPARNGTVRIVCEVAFYIDASYCLYQQKSHGRDNGRDGDSQIQTIVISCKNGWAGVCIISPVHILSCAFYFYIL